MPHDCKGRLIEVGDVVRGTGYNLKHQITGAVVGVTPGAEACNVSIATIIANNQHYTEYGTAVEFEIMQKKDGTIPE